MDRTEASTAPARGGDRTDRRHRGQVPVRPVLAALGGVAVVFASLVVVTGPGPTAGAAGNSSHPTHGSGPSGPTLTLLAPPTVAGPSSPFALRLGLSGTAALTGFTLGVTVYSHLRDPTEFDETLGGSPVGTVVASSDPILLSSLPPDPSGGVDLSVPVTAGGVTGPGTGPFTVDLSCQLGSCGGVYPARLVLTDTATDTVTSRLLTYLVYTDPSGDIEPLHFALVVPLALSSPTTGSPSPTDGSDTVTPASLAPLTNLIGALSGSRASVPLTLAPSPATVAALDADRRARSKSALSSLVALTAAADRQTLCGSFVPVNANALVAIGQGGDSELAEQVRRGDEVLNSVPGLHAESCGTTNAWVVDGTLGSAALRALAGLGYDDIVVPPSAVAGPPPSRTPTQRFTLDGSSRPGNAILSDPGLSSRLASTSRTDPALTADQILAELELDYYEAPNTAFGRGVVAAPPVGWRADPVIVSDLLDGLQNNPMVDAVTLATLFADVHVGGEVEGVVQPSDRRPAAVNTDTGLSKSGLVAARGQLTGLAAAVSASKAGSALVTGLGDQLLASESGQLTPTQQRAALRRFEQSFGHQLALVSITSRDARLTARTGSVPITVNKSAPYPVVAVLTVTSDKIVFSAGGAQALNPECRSPVITTTGGRSSVSTQCTFIHGTNAVYIEMRSRVSGRFRMSVTLDSPQGALQLADGQLTVQSMSTSAVAIALSVAAGAVLLGWWGRTLWRTRRSRRGAHCQQGGAS